MTVRLINRELALPRRDPNARIVEVQSDWWDQLLNLHSAIAVLKLV